MEKSLIIALVVIIVVSGFVALVSSNQEGGEKTAHSALRTKKAVKKADTKTYSVEGSTKSIHAGKPLPEKMREIILRGHRDTFITFHPEIVIRDYENGISFQCSVTNIPFSIGRNDNNNVVVDNMTISGKQCMIDRVTKEGDSYYYIKNLSGKNEMFYLEEQDNGEPGWTSFAELLGKTFELDVPEGEEKMDFLVHMGESVIMKISIPNQLPTGRPVEAGGEDKEWGKQVKMSGKQTCPYDLKKERTRGRRTGSSDVNLDAIKDII